MLVDALLQAGHTVISASSLAVWGDPTMLQRRMGRLVLVGDMVRGVGPGQPVLAPRVVMAAALEADAVIEQLLGHNALKPRFQPMNQHEFAKFQLQCNVPLIPGPLSLNISPDTQFPCPGSSTLACCNTVPVSRQFTLALCHKRHLAYPHTDSTVKK